MKTPRIVLLSNDYAERAAARGACAEAVAWMRSAQHMSLRAMWNEARPLWRSWVFHRALRHREAEAVYLTGLGSMSAPWSYVEMPVRRWFGLPKAPR